MEEIVGGHRPVIIATAKPWTLTREEFALVRKFYVSDRSTEHAESICRRCGLTIGAIEKRAEFAIRSETTVPIIKGFVHSRCLHGEV
jgi:hypothetical protein